MSWADKDPGTVDRLHDAEYIDIIEILYKEADRKDESSAYAGGTGGAGGDLRRQTQMYVAGREHGIPKEFQEFVDQYRKERDPEYEQYLRLKEKFEK